MKARAYTLFWLFCILLGCANYAVAQDANVGFSDGINRNAEDFVRVSLLVADPSDILYSCSGHCALRMECPTFGLDYIYSYEGENVHHQALRFFAGKLMMGMVSMPTDDYLADYREQGRGVRMYPLNLPPHVEQNLWRILDEKVAEGMELPYDYIVRGCALSTSMFVREALDDTPIEYAPWTDYNYHTIREQFCVDNLQDARWSSWVISNITGTNVDKEYAPEDMLVRPFDLRDTWLKAKVDGKPLMLPDYEQLVPAGEGLHGSFFTPMLVACLFLLLALLNCFLDVRAIDWFIMGVQTIFGIAVVYMVCFSDMPNNQWNWLIVPFNPLPLLTWHWRRYFKYVWAGIDLAWCAAMLLAPHVLTDPANIVFVLAFCLMLIAPKKQLLCSRNSSH